MVTLARQVIGKILSPMPTTDRSLTTMQEVVDPVVEVIAQTKGIGEQKKLSPLEVGAVVDIHKRREDRSTSSMETINLHLSVVDAVTEATSSRLTIGVTRKAETLLQGPMERASNRLTPSSTTLKLEWISTIGSKKPPSAT